MIALPAYPHGKSIIADANGYALCQVWPVDENDDVQAKRDEIVEALNLHGELMKTLPLYGEMADVLASFPGIYDKKAYDKWLFLRDAVLAKLGGSNP